MLPGDWGRTVTRVFKFPAGPTLISLAKPSNYFRIEYIFNDFVVRFNIQGRFIRTNDKAMTLLRGSVSKEFLINFVCSKL